MLPPSVSKARQPLHLAWIVPVLVLLLSGHTAQAVGLDVEVTDKEGNPVADAVVSLIADKPGPATRPAGATMDQRGLEFIPHVLAVQRGSAVIFPNSDQVRHQVYSFSPAKKFELRLYKAIPSEPVVFDRAGVATIGCNIHDWMLGYIVVVDTPWFAKSDAAGTLKIDGLPAGGYQMSIWHPRAIAADPGLSKPLDLSAPVTEEAITIRLGPPPPPAAPPSALEQKFRAYRKSVPDGP